MNILQKDGAGFRGAGRFSCYNDTIMIVGFIRRIIWVDLISVEYSWRP
jgi:hypothetical protein